MDTQTRIQKLTEKMRRLDPHQYRALIGFDGFVDEVVYVVDKRIDAEHYKRMNYLRDYGERIIQSAGLSMNIEMVTIQQKLGGNGPIFANSLLSHGMRITYIGAMGKNSLHEVYRDMARRCTAISISDPGRTDAIEFLDGKIISSKLESLKEVCWQTLMERVGLDRLVQMIDESDFIGFENWTLVVNTTGIWRHIIQDVIPKLKPCPVRKNLFIDLADPEKRMPDDILECLGLVEELSRTFRLTLGLNKKEAYEIAELLGLEPGRKFERLADLLTFLKARLKIDVLVVHPVEEAGAIGSGEPVVVKGPLCMSPKLTTGAGDNFNAGFALGQVLGLGLEDSLLIGVANSGFYVRQARSPKYQELIGFLDRWDRGQLTD